MFNSTTKAPLGIAFLFLLCFGLSASLQAQQAGKPDGNLINFVNTNANGGQLAHIQSGAFGSFNAADRWIGIGNPTFGGALLPVYGIRIQDSEQSATMSLNNNGGAGNLDFELQWGPEAGSKFRLNFINDITNPAALTNVMTALPNGRVGFGEDNPGLARVVIVEPGADGLNATSDNIVGAGVEGIGGLFGVYGRGSTANNPGIQLGVYGLATNPGISNYGVYGSASNFSDTLRLAYGVFGAASTNNTNSLAGFFSGNVNVTGVLTQGSDRRLKDNIQNEAATMDQIMQLRPTTYQFKNKGEFADLNLASGQQHGFIAQELEEVFPELVGRATAMLGQNLDEENFSPGRQFEFRTVNYMALIPILTKGMQEQQTTIVDLESLMEEKDNSILRLEAEIADIRAELAEMKSGSSLKGSQANPNGNSANVLYQNTPNPFSESTLIRYELNAGATGQMLVFDMNGRQLRSYDLRADQNSVTIEGNELEAGMYFYSLIVNGEEIDTRRMILTK